MTYKQQMKTNELITKVRIIRFVKKDRVPIVQTANAFSCHRNTIRNILDLFEAFSAKDKLRLLESSFTQEELFVLYGSLLNKSRKPNSHKRSATHDQEEDIRKLFKDDGLKVGSNRMFTILKRRYDGHEKEDTADVLSLTPWQLRGIYKRQELRPEKTRSSNGEVRRLYDYASLSCFEKLHYDVKYVSDQHALPEAIYKLFSQREIPKYEWNILDAKSRFRFLAYSYQRPTEFGLRFLLFAIQYLRASLVAYDQDMLIGFDNGMEFCGGSQRKEEVWNTILANAHAGIYSYTPHFDIRKNLIERSHLTDDEELYIPRGNYMGTKKAFMKEASDYLYYWNYQRPHSGIGMNNRTPFEVLKQSGLVGAEKLLTFPVFIIEDVLDALRKCTVPLEFETYAKSHPEMIQKSLTDQKLQRDIQNRFLLSTNAQNVLTYYPVRVQGNCIFQGGNKKHKICNSNKKGSIIILTTNYSEAFFMKKIPQHTIRLQDGSLCNVNKRIVRESKPLIAFFSEIPDPRSAQGRRHSLVLILLIVFIAFLRGSKDLKDAHLFAIHAHKMFRKHFQMIHGIPDPTTISRVFQELESEQMIKAFVSFLKALRIPLGSVVSFDGKTEKGVSGKDAVRHVLSFFSHDFHLALGQVGVSAKENEIPAFGRLLSQLSQSLPVSELLFLGDALHTQKDTITAILEKKADYLFVVKGNQKDLFEAIQMAFSETDMKNIYQAENKPSVAKDTYTYGDVGRKRSVTTTINSTHDLELITYLKEAHGFEGIQTVGILKRTGERISKDGTVTKVDETIGFISSKVVSAKEAAKHLRGHWCIENNLHWVKDVVFLEDKQTVRLGNAPQIMSFIRSMCISVFNICHVQSISDAIHNLEKSQDLHSRFLQMAAIV